PDRKSSWSDGRTDTGHLDVARRPHRRAQRGWRVPLRHPPPIRGRAGSTHAVTAAPTREPTRPPLIPLPPARHLLRAKDLIDARYREPLEVPTLARAAHLSPAHFSREFRRAFGETPHQYLLTRRLERAAALLRNTDH